MRVAAVALFVSGCSFVGVRGPSDRVSILPDDPSKLSCTESTVLPTLDSLGGAAGLVVAGGGIVLEQTSDDGKPENFTKYYAGPIAVAAILYFISASFGNNRVTWCTDAKERTREARTIVQPIPPDDRPKQPKPVEIAPPTPEPEPIEAKPEPEPTKPAPKKPKAAKPKPPPKQKPPPIEMEPDPI